MFCLGLIIIRNLSSKFPKSNSTLALFLHYLTVVAVPLDYELPCNSPAAQQKIQANGNTAGKTGMNPDIKDLNRAG